MESSEKAQFQPMELKVEMMWCVIEQMTIG